MSIMSILSIVLATAIPIVFLFIIYRLDLYKMGEFRFVMMCFVSGGLAFAAAYFINPFMFKMGWVNREQMVRYSAPIVEEILKALILIYMVRRANFTYFVDGAIYGFAAGIGFAVFENYQYILSNQSAALTVAISRVLSTNLIHASATALTGIAFGYSNFQKSYKRILVVLAGLLTAMALHMGFNNLVSRVGSGLLVLIYAVVVAFIATAFIYYMMRRGLAEQRTWIAEKLGTADRVTVSEAAVVDHLDKVRELIAPIVTTFGKQKGEQVEHFLVLQAQLGIKRKAVDKLADAGKRKAVEEQVKELSLEMDTARKAVGSYVMLYVRMIFPEENSPLWGRVQDAIEEKIANRAQGKGSGVDAFANLQGRLKQSTPTPGAPPAERPASAWFKPTPGPENKPEEKK